MIFEICKTSEGLRTEPGQVEVNSIEELLELVELAGEIVIKRGEHTEYCIEIYDTYRE